MFHDSRFLPFSSTPNLNDSIAFINYIPKFQLNSCLWLHYTLVVQSTKRLKTIQIHQIYFH